MNPLKQGLKPQPNPCITPQPERSLSMNPLKQGLKRVKRKVGTVLLRVFIHESIKTRVETSKALMLLV